MTLWHLFLILFFISNLRCEKLSLENKHQQISRVKNMIFFKFIHFNYIRFLSFFFRIKSLFFIFHLPLTRALNLHHVKTYTIVEIMPLNTPLLRFKQLLKKLNARFLNYFSNDKNKTYHCKTKEIHRFHHVYIEPTS